MKIFKIVFLSCVFSVNFLVVGNSLAVCVDYGDRVDYEPNENPDAYDHCKPNADNILIEYSCAPDNGVESAEVDCKTSDGLGYCDINKCAKYDNKPQITFRVRDAGPFEVGKTVTLLYSVNLGCVGVECTKRAADKCDIIISGPENGVKSVPSENSSGNYNVGMVHYVAGTYNYTLKCSNSYGESTASGSAQVIGGPSGGPVATILSPSEGEKFMAGSQVAFSGTGAGIGGTYKWCSGSSCGGGNIVLQVGSSSSLTRFFQEPAYGWNRTALEVTDSKGNVSTNSPSVAITITPNPICHNGIKDGDEYGIDCGGSICSLCDVDLSGPLNLNAFCDVNGAMDIDWLKVANADRYELRIKDKEFGICTFPNLQTELSENSYNWNGESNKVYYVSVRAIAENGEKDVIGDSEVIEVSCNGVPGGGGDGGDDGDGEGGDGEGDDGEDNPNPNQLNAIIDNPLDNPTSIFKNESVDFLGHGTDPNGKTITSYEWRLENCLTGELANNSASFSKTFPEIGNYNFYLRVQNQDGTWSSNCPHKRIRVLNDDSCSGEGGSCGEGRVCCSDLLCKNNVCEEGYVGDDPVKFRR